MNNKEMMNALRATVELIAVILIVVTIVLKVCALETLRLVIMCSCILLLITVTFIFDGILRDGKKMALHGFCYALCFLFLIKNLFKM